ncbi:MAG TPA: TonB family protein [Xanthomonadaceae bacterium]|nr:TonB family protein [Xanthomonadaceae bacterium]
MTPGFRLALSALPAAIVTMALVSFMQFLITGKPGGADPTSSAGIRFGSIEVPQPPPPVDTRKPPQRTELTQPPGVESLGEGRLRVRHSPSPPEDLILESPDLPPISKIGPIGPPTSDSSLVVLSQVQPAYPVEAALRGIQGWVEVEFTVRIDGSTGDILIKSADPPRVFNSAAIAAVQRWRFQAPTVDGTPQPIRTQQRITFVLTD